jgi:hypothetical protein
MTWQLESNTKPWTGSESCLPLDHWIASRANGLRLTQLRGSSSLDFTPVHSDSTKSSLHPSPYTGHGGPLSRASFHPVFSPRITPSPRQRRKGSLAHVEAALSEESDSSHNQTIAAPPCEVERANQLATEFIRPPKATVQGLCTAWRRLWSPSICGLPARMRCFHYTFILRGESL